MPYKRLCGRDKLRLPLLRVVHFDPFWHVPIERHQLSLTFPGSQWGETFFHFLSIFHCRYNRVLFHSEGTNNPDKQAVGLQCTNPSVLTIPPTPRWLFPFLAQGAEHKGWNGKMPKLSYSAPKACLLHTLSSSDSSEKSEVKRPSPAVKGLMKKKEKGRTHQLRLSPNINKNRSTSLSCAAVPSQLSSDGFSPTLVSQLISRIWLKNLPWYNNAF